MRNISRKILFVLVLMFTFIVNVNAETILEDASKYDGDVYIIGSSKFDSDVIVTGTMASKAGAREAYIQYFINENFYFNADDLKIYYYSSLDKVWSLLPATKDDQIRDLTEEEVKELTEELRIYYVNEKEKILEIPFVANLKDGYDLVFGVDDPSKLNDVKYEENKIFVPATVRMLQVYAKDENDAYMLLDSFEQVDTVFESKMTVVKTLEELKDAIASEKEEIILGSDITGITETIKIPYSVTLRGSGYKLSFENIQKIDGTASGLVISGEGSLVENLTIEMDDKKEWQGNYGLQVYNANGVMIINYKGTKADAALLVNSSFVMIQGNIDVSGNEFGGIEVSKGTAEGLENSSLHVNGNIVMADEAIGKPAVWLENGQGYVVLHEEYSLVDNINVPQVLGKSQTFYYTSDSVYENVEVTTADELLLAAALSDVESIKLASDIDLNSKLDVKKELVLDLNEKTLKPNATMANDAVIVVWPEGKLTIEGEGTVDGAKQTNNHSMAVWVYGGELIINGGIYTNVGAKDFEDNGKPNNNELIYVSNSGKVTINGGKFIGNTENETYGPRFTLNMLDNDLSSIVVTGGTFVGFNPADNKAEGEGTNFVADGYKAVESNGEYTIVEIDESDAVIVDGFAYDDINEAITNAKVGSTLKLLKNIDLSNKLDIKKALVLDLNEKTLKPNATMANDAVIVVWPEGKLTIEGEGTVDGAKQTNNHSMAVWVYGGELIINGGTYTNVGAKDFEDNGKPNNNELIYVSNSGKVTINGGKFIGNTENETYGPRFTLNMLDNDLSSIVVTGGTFVGFNPADNKAEGEGTNFVAEGYKAVESNGEYTVVVNE